MSAAIERLIVALRTQTTTAVRVERADLERLLVEHRRQAHALAEIASYPDDRYISAIALGGLSEDATA